VPRNGSVYAVDGEDGVAQAVAVREGCIVYVGTDNGATAPSVAGPA
jgi:predicted amidohydrolase YtcJ